MTLSQGERRKKGFDVALVVVVLVLQFRRELHLISKSMTTLALLSTRQQTQDMFPLSSQLVLIHESD